MIVSFGSKDTALIYQELRPKKLRLPDYLLAKALDKLRMLDAAEAITDFYQPPSNHFEALRGDKSGFFSIRINNQWRIVFRFAEGQAHDVTIMDYH